MRKKMAKCSISALVSLMFLIFFVSTASAIHTASISLVKSCTDASAPGEPILFSATLTNTGEDNIINIFCEDVPYADLSGVPGSLPYGASATITGSYIPTTNPSTDTITCNGTGQYTKIAVTASASATCSYPDDGGCTLTPGYWKTHSMYGPAPYDEVWATIGEDSSFYLSGHTYYAVLWTAPSGNAYYILAHQFIAAILNVNKGASVPSNAQAALDEAEIFFETYTPAQIGVLKGNSELRAKFVWLAGVLDDYNNGISGPGHCTK